MRKHCPKEETLVDFMEGRLSGRQQSRIESHLVDCATCREQVGLCLQLTDPQGGMQFDAAPQHLTDKAVKLVTEARAPRPSRPLMQGARRWVAKGVALLEQLTPANDPQPVMVRSADEMLTEGCISRQKQFEDIWITIEIERGSDDLALIRIVCPEYAETGQPVRVALFKGDREIASMMLVDAPLVFDDIAFGGYRLVLTRNGISMGEYLFKIVADADSAER